MKDKTIAVVGLWHLGSVTAACLSKYFSNVIGFDEDLNLIDKLNVGILPIYEPGLDDLIKEGVDQNRLTFTGNIHDLDAADYIWITIDTPIDENDNCDLSGIKNIIEKLTLLKVKNFIISSQVPTGTTDNLLSTEQVNQGYRIAYIPENLQLGKAIHKFNHPDMLVIGSDHSDYGTEIAQLLEEIDNDPIVCDSRTAELSKHAINSFLATSISFSNQLSDIAIATKANAYQMVEIMKRDQRIGTKLPLFPGPWFSGGTLARDIRSLQKIGSATNTNTSIFDSVMDTNTDRIETTVQRVKNHIDLNNAKVTLLGLVYTEATDTLRRSPGLQLIRKLKQYNTSISAYDPMIKESPESEVEIYNNPIDAVRGADAVIIVKAGCAKGITLQEITAAMNGHVVMDLWHVFKDETVNNEHSTYLKPGCE